MWINEYLDRHQVVQALAGIRCEWEEAADGVSLVEIPGSVGMLLIDVTTAIGLTGEEQAQALGAELAGELHNVMIPVPGGNGRA
jgi:hypothetical protein